MIDDEIIRKEILGQFSALSPDEEEIELELIPQVVFYKKSKGKVECFCTHCRQRWVEDKASRVRQSEYAHKTAGRCSKCGHAVVRQSAGYSTSKLTDDNTKSIISIIECDNDIYIRGYIVKPKYYDTFAECVKDVEYDYEELQRYYFGKHGVQHWNIGWGYKAIDNNWFSFWKPLKSEHEPVFKSTYFGNNDNRYMASGIENINKSTYFKYMPHVRDIRKYIEYIGLYFKHPNVEYLINGGFENVVKELVDERAKCYINWKSDNLKKMLGLNSEEINRLAGQSASYICSYKMLRKAFPKAECENLCDIVKKYNCYCSEICTIAKLTKLSLVKILNYAKKNSLTAYRFSDWIDYLDNCKTLEYVLTDSDINRPKKFREAHDRAAALIDAKKNEQYEKKIANRGKKLKKLCIESEQFVLIPPKSVIDIVNEGKVLHHCVGTYVKKHAAGECAILFLRKKENLEEPFYTVEVRNNQIWQYRGYKNNLANNPVPEEVTEFINQYKIFLSERKAG